MCYMSEAVVLVPAIVVAIWVASLFRGTYGYLSKKRYRWWNKLFAGTVAFCLVVIVMSAVTNRNGEYNRGDDPCAGFDDYKGCQVDLLNESRYSD